MKRKLLILLVFGAVGAAAYVYLGDGSTEPPQVRTAATSRGDVVDLVQATGKLEPLTTVTVGSQVSGVISWLGADFNSIVRRGEVIARLDPSLLQAQVEQAEANLTKVMADVRQRQIALADSKMKHARAEKLAAGGLASQTDLENAALVVLVAETTVEAVEAQVVQAQASLNQAKLNLSHSAILAPIDGIVIQRSVDVGQTVAASLSSPTIFLIAADLTRMKVNASVDEGDISEIQPGQEVSVSVDAYAGETFPGVVSQIRLQPQVVSNVTTYTTIIDVANDALKLKPGMTASVKIEIARRDDVLRVPNAALRFRPTAEILAALGQVAPTPAQEGPSSRTNRSSVSGAVVTTVSRDSATVRDAVRLESAVAGPAEATTGSLGQVWIQENGGLRSIPVRIGLTDGTHTELLTSELEPGSVLVTGVTIPAAKTTASAGAASSVFTGSSGQGQGFGGGRGGFGR